MAKTRTRTYRPVATAKKKKTPGRKPPLLQRKLPLRPLIVAYICLITVSAVTAALIAQTQTTALPDPFKSEQRSSANFRLYYPDHLPADFYVDMASLGNVQDSVVAMRITDGRGSLGRSFTISQQSTPDGFNFRTFLGSFSDTQTIKTDIGEATLGTIDSGSTRIASLVTDQSTWILIQAPSSVTADELAEVLKSLQPSS